MPDKVAQIGITGGIGSGKTVVARIFTALGIPVYNADDRAKALQEEDTDLKASIREAFGDKAYLADGRLNRSYLAEVVFRDPEKLKRINELVHPAVADDYRQWVQQHAGAPYVLKEAALLYETGSYQALDRVIVVTAPESLRIDRVLQRDKHRTREAVEAIIAKQLPEQEKIDRADFVIVNDEKQLLIPQVLDIHEVLKNRTPGTV